MTAPDVVFKHGSCMALIFFEQANIKVVFRKRVLDSNGEWIDARSLDVDDLPKAVLVLSKAFDYLTAGT